MLRSAVLVVVAVVGCNAATTPQADSSPKATPENKSPTVEQKSEHDYQGWKRYAPTESGFEVWFPREPQEKAASPATGNLHVAGVQRRAVDELAFTCQWKINDKPRANREAEVAYLLGQQTGALNSTKGRLVDGRTINLDGWQGREFTIAINNEHVSRVRTYLVGKRMISLQVLGKDAEAVRSNDAKTFFESLKINQ
jgi:hypothetical protein